ncbi:MAG: hypothetical protein AAGH15_17285, partial [Myxococcota bacterium]
APSFTAAQAEAATTADEHKAEGPSAAVVASLSVAGAGALVTTVAGALALRQRNVLDAAGCAPECSGGEVDVLRRRSIVADLGLGVALVGVTLGVLLLLSGEEDARAVALSPWAGPRGGGAALTGRF